MNTPPPIEDIKQQYAGVFIVTNSGKIVGQKRDDKPGIDNPGKVSTFGGTIEPEEDPAYAAWREIVQEETNLRIEPQDIHFLYQDVSWREMTSEWEVKYFYYTVIKDEEVERLEVYEGQGWAYINGPDDPELVDAWRDATKVMTGKLPEILKA